MPGRHLLVWVAVDLEAEEVPLGSIRTARTDPDSIALLTKREREVMALVAVGHEGPAIAERLFVSPETVKSHVQNAMEKLDAHTRAHAVSLCLISGQIDWDA